jgi:hypothetical protein
MSVNNEFKLSRTGTGKKDLPTGRIEWATPRAEI